MGRREALIAAALFAANALAQETSIEATTAAGEKVRLLPNGRWEYVDPVKAGPQKKAREAEAERERSTQGGWLGGSRKIYEGDKDYNRGSLGRR